MKDTKAKKGALAKKDSKKEPKKVEDKQIRKKKVVAKEPAKAKKRVRKAKVKKDPNQPKRPQGAFFIFLKEFRETYKEDNPDSRVTQVVKAGGEKWKEMSESDKVPYHAKAAQNKTEYEKSLAAYKQKQEKEDDEGTAEESDKSKSEVNDEEESMEEEEEEDDDQEE